MCGIVGLLVRDQALEAHLGLHFSAMLEEMTTRGPDSAGMAIYDRGVPNGSRRWSLRGDGDSTNWKAVQSAVNASSGTSSDIEIIDNIAFLVTAATEAAVLEGLKHAAAERPPQ